MKLRRSVMNDDLDINLIPLIDVLLVIIIFLMVTATFKDVTELDVNLPQSGTIEDAPSASVIISIDANSRIAIGKHIITNQSTTEIVSALNEETAKLKDPLVVIHADAKAVHQAVVNVMEASKRAGLQKIAFATEVN